VPELKHFRLPDVGEGLTEAEIVSWKVKPGDTVRVNDVVVEIETAKSLVELPSPYAGVVAELLMRGRDPGLGEARRAGLKGGVVPSLGHKERQAASREWNLWQS